MISIDNIDAIIFDFDGVLTNNLVHLDQDGREWVSCSRADGLAFDVLQKMNKLVYILSTEKNPVVTARANKLKVPVLQGVANKANALDKLIKDMALSAENILYVGNDLNDYQIMHCCGYSACPSDSHPQIKEIATFSLSSKGGEGVARELLEDIFQLDFLNLLFIE